MEQRLKSRLKRTSVKVWLLLIYVVAALVWWFISLERQNKEMYIYQQNHLNTIIIKEKQPVLYATEFRKIYETYRRTTIKYASEGIVFLGLIILGAVLVFRSMRKQIMVQEQQQNFMMAVTHELKTPIAVSKLNLETILKHQLDEQRMRKLILASLDETKRLDFLTNNILISAQIENKGYEVNKEELDFSALLMDRIKEFKNRFLERTINSEVDEGIDLQGDSLLLQILINNLIENALKYSEKNEAITVGLHRNTDYVKLFVSDQGIGIPEEERQKIYSQFYRIGNEATRKKKGTGLGLYLCAKIAQGHNADILMTNNQPKGSTFVVKFID
ncbi:MAG TPA: HAMP domain-containing sensor histidine kinase [Niabella sp.]|nr:HAMP domain-containing sensor histidine kinase [Niabella sp.]HOZ96002.1 HAMP domain-containing sensor histidine kinase [Niabella sp.]HQW15503.1 HAMP domain-containing sensor histidine kinase [Niabella sp.]HQX20645.1 HAMP domain-containing sensor histidine kinase [Niabella sp.]HQX40521.1 HAMP domain-containing sensor histidine kinase [Niabella sp.]